MNWETTRLSYIGTGLYNSPMARRKRRETPEKDLGRRFAEPFGSLLWHADGTPFTAQEYRDAGFKPPTQRMLRAFAEQEG